MPVAALVGYTNAGKTTLLNRLTGAGAVVRDQLFTTLDPLARRVRLPAPAAVGGKPGQGGETIVITDTVGFLHHLPHHLIEAFKATLEEARDADLLLHVLDASHPLISKHAEAVETVLKELELQDKPIITVLNKCDKLAGQAEDADSRLAALAHAFEPAAVMSAKTGQGLEQLEALISAQLARLLVAPLHLRLPHERADLLASIYQTGQVLSRREYDGAIELTARVPAKMQAVLEPYLTS